MAAYRSHNEVLAAMAQADRYRGRIIAAGGVAALARTHRRRHSPASSLVDDFLPVRLRLRTARLLASLARCQSVVNSAALTATHVQMLFESAAIGKDADSSCECESAQLRP